MTTLYRLIWSLLVDLRISQTSRLFRFVETRAFGRDTSDPFQADAYLPCPPFFVLDDGTVIELRTADDYRTHFGHEPNAGTLRAYEALEERDTWPSPEPKLDASLLRGRFDDQPTLNTSLPSLDFDELPDVDGAAKSLSEPPKGAA